jgi:tetratricopeptide (TPR) repeat protein
MGSVHLATDDPSRALKLYYESLPLFEKVHNTEGVAKVYNIIGVFKTGSRDYDTAEFYLKRAVDLNLKINNRHGIIENEGNLGYLYEMSGKLAEAEKIYLKLVDELSGMDDKINLPVIYFNLASLFQKKEISDSALYYLGKAINIAEQTRDSSLLCTLFGNTGEIFLNKGNRDSASVYLQKSVNFSQAIDDVETEMQAMSLLVKVDSLSGNFKSAYLKTKQIAVLKDSVYQRKINNNIKTSELQYENEKRKRLIEIQQLSIQSAKKERVLYIVLLAVSVIILGLITMVFIQRRRNYLKNQELFEKQMLVKRLELDKLQKEEEINKLKIDKFEEVLSIKERELVSIAMAVEQKNELLYQISKKIKGSVRDTTDDNQWAVINEIVSSIKMQKSDSESADLFNQRFSMIHHDFFTDLKKAHPELTNSDLKFCAYLRIHLSSGQIATILNVTNEAIRKTRYRLRKKFKLSPEESLEDYVLKF